VNKRGQKTSKLVELSMKTHIWWMKSSYGFWHGKIYSNHCENEDNIKDLVDTIPMFAQWVAKIDGSLYLLLVVQGTNLFLYDFSIFFVDCCN